MILSLNQRCNKDERTICELFYILVSELADVTFNHSLYIIMQALIATVAEYFKISEDQLDEFTSGFISKLPKYMQTSLLGSESALA